MRELFALFAFCCFFAACTDAAHEAPRPAPLSERQGLQPAPATRLGFAADCTQFEGNQGCASDLCLRLLPGFPSRGVCSVKCRPEDGTSCPVAKGERWICKQV